MGTLTPRYLKANPVVVEEPPQKGFHKYPQCQSSCAGAPLLGDNVVPVLWSHSGGHWDGAPGGSGQTGTPQDKQEVSDPL